MYKNYIDFILKIQYNNIRQEVKVKNIIISLTQTLKDELKQEANEKGLSLSAYIRMILIERNK